MNEQTDLLRIEGLSVSFPLWGGNIHAVKNISMRIRPGEVTALVGESGSGKSVLGRAVMGIETPSARTAGRILFNDPDTAESIDLLALPNEGRKMRSIRGNRIGMIFQEPMTSFSPMHTVGNQIEEVLKVHTVLMPKERRERCEEMLSLVGFANPARAFEMYPFELSGGMRQRAMIAMALVCRPSLLIADEPTTALDVTIQAQILKLLRDLQSSLGMAILLITHDLGVVASMADEVVVVYRGEVMEAGPVDAIFRHARHPYTQGLMAAVPDFDMPREARLKPLREIEVNAAGLMDRKRSSDAGSDVLLSVRNISKSFVTKRGGGYGLGQGPATLAVNDVSFDIKRGETLGLVGESGCGKTTLSKILMRGVTADAGEVEFQSERGAIDVLKAKGSDLNLLRQRVQMVFQDPISSLSPRMTVRNIVSEPLEIHQRGDGKARLEAVRRLMKAIGLPENAMGRYPHSFSGGQRQRIGIARALALGPDLLICDEPVSALDVSIQAQILNLMKDLKKELGLTYLFISHNLAVVNYMADRVAVMYAGRIVEIAPCDVIMRNPVHPYTKKLLAAVPTPNLDRPLDFAAIGQPSAEAKKLWARQFQEEAPGDLAHADLGQGHLVLARRNVDIRELRA